MSTESEADSITTTPLHPKDKTVHLGKFFVLFFQSSFSKKISLNMKMPPWPIMQTGWVKTGLPS